MEKKDTYDMNNVYFAIEKDMNFYCLGEFKSVEEAKEEFPDELVYLSAKEAMNLAMKIMEEVNSDIQNHIKD